MKPVKQSITFIFREDDNGKMVAYMGESNFQCRAVDISIIDSALAKMGEILDNIKINDGNSTRKHQPAGRRETATAEDSER